MVTGTRKDADVPRIRAVLDTLYRTLLIRSDRAWELCAMTGGAPGTDRAVEGWCHGIGVAHLPYPADWEHDRNAAGPIRNQRMIDEGRPDLVFAFGMRPKSGTADATARAKLAGIPVWVDGEDFSPDRLRLESGQILQHHPQRLCAPPCSIHGPSQHHMVTWPRAWYPWAKMVCRMCPHGTPHPDPDDLLYRARQAGEWAEMFWEGIHYCPCHCCNTPAAQKEITHAQ